MRNHALLYAIFLLLFGCDNAADKIQKDDLSYFDIKGYFAKEASRLTKASPFVIKTVQVDSSSETRRTKIPDWKKELAVFSDADMNRASWKGLFRTRKSKDEVVYTSDNEKVPVKEMHVIYKNNKVSGFRILIKNSNYLYTSVDSLAYYPDSVYQVKKTQDIRLLNDKSYIITTKF